MEWVVFILRAALKIICSIPSSFLFSICLKNFGAIKNLCLLVGTSLHSSHQKSVKLNWSINLFWQREYNHYKNSNIRLSRTWQSVQASDDVPRTRPTDFITTEYIPFLQGEHCVLSCVRPHTVLLATATRLRVCLKTRTVVLKCVPSMRHELRTVDTSACSCATKSQTDFVTHEHSSDVFAASPRATVRWTMNKPCASYGGLLLWHARLEAVFSVSCENIHSIEPPPMLSRCNAEPENQEINSNHKRYR